MSRSSSAASRNLSLTEELEKLEQSITLTLQEIDSNFSKAHRIVTTTILPLVEQYGEHSKAVWEATKFWKQFFEASANVSLSGYEELAYEEDTLATATDQSSTVHDGTVTTDADYTPRPNGDNDTTVGDGSTVLQQQQQQQQQHHYRNRTEDSLLSDGEGDLTGSTPRMPATRTVVVPPPSSKPQFADLGSPYEALKRELKSEADTPDARARGAGYGDEDDDDEDTEVLFQQHTARLPRLSMTPRGSPGGSGDAEQLGGHDAEEVEEEDAMGEHGKNKDRLLHRVLDKNYRLMATPHKGIATGVSPLKWKVTAAKDDAGKGKEKDNTVGVPAWQDDPMSSPEMAVPQLRSAAFMSPMRAAYRSKYDTAEVAGRAPRTPGVSVQTPGFGGGKKTKDVYGDAAAGGKDKKFVDEITWESDSDDEAFRGMSPPKTIQFALPPSKLLQTPAREASKRIVDDILLTAGADLDDLEEEYSPTVVKMNPDVLDDTF